MFQYYLDKTLWLIWPSYLQVPLNPWAKDRKLKEIGRYEQVNVIEGIEAYSLALFTRVLGWSNEQAQVFFAGVRKEVKDRSLHLYVKAYFVYGQKPEWACPRLFWILSSFCDRDASTLCRCTKSVTSRSLSIDRSHYSFHDLLALLPRNPCQLSSKLIEQEGRVLLAIQAIKNMWFSRFTKQRINLISQRQPSAVTVRVSEIAQRKATNLKLNENDENLLTNWVFSMGLRGLLPRSACCCARNGESSARETWRDHVSTWR